MASGSISGHRVCVRRDSLIETVTKRGCASQFEQDITRDSVLEMQPDKCHTSLQYVWSTICMILNTGFNCLKWGYSFHMMCFYTFPRVKFSGLTYVHKIKSQDRLQRCTMVCHDKFKNRVTGEATESQVSDSILFS